MGIEELYEKYEQHLLRFARSMVSDKGEAEDLVQDTFLKALASIQLISTLSDYQIKSWLFRVLKNCLIDKKRKGKFEMLTEFMEQQNEMVAESDMDIKIITQDAMSVLPEKSRDIVYKKYWLGMTSKEIADRLSIPASTVRYHLSTGINLLKNKYDLD